MGCDSGRGGCMSDTAAVILKELAALGAYTRLVDGQLRVRPPNGGLPVAIRVPIRDHGRQLVAVLTPQHCNGCGGLAYWMPRTRCFRCRQMEALECNAV